MGQYHSVYNITKKQYFRIGGAKLCEQVSEATAQALLMLLSNSNGRGGGDFNNASSLIGSWAGDKLVVQGDYAKKGDKGFISERTLEGFENITNEVFNMIETDPVGEAGDAVKSERDFLKSMGRG